MSIFQKVLFQGTSPFNGEIKVVEGSGERRLIASSYTQSRSLDRDGKTRSYWDGFVNNLPPLTRNSRILILGLAAGTIAKLLTRKLGNVTIDGVEIDPLMVELGKKYFDFTEKNVNVIIADALEFVKDARYKYDLICIDLFKDGGTAVGIDSTDFFRKVKDLMTENCSVIINQLFTTHEDLNVYRGLLKDVFSRVETSSIRNGLSIGNVILYAYK